MIELKCNPVVKNINARATGGDDDRLVFADITLEASVDPAEVNQFVENASQHLWYTPMDSEIPAPRFVNLAQMKVSGKWQNIDMILAPSADLIAGVSERFYGGELQKIKFDPMSGCALINFTYSCQIPGAEIGKLVDQYLGQQAYAEILYNQGELDLGSNY